ncbi:MAG: GIY-YIG nuclease family protein, partial [Bacteroidetes bacterium]|nr:GIY-YIG nuclease family protein [Bacteroidota bacterium]
YIIFSQKLNRFYVGAALKNVSERIHKHNEHAYESKR